jgi:hypothetical protein
MIESLIFLAMILFVGIMFLIFCVIGVCGQRLREVTEAIDRNTDVLRQYNYNPPIEGDEWKTGDEE